MAEADSTQTDYQRKRCRTCGLVKPLDDFHRQNTSKDGRLSHCRPCFNAKVRKQRQSARVTDITEKRCSRCESVQPIDNFAQSGRYTYGRKSWCRSCDSRQRAERRESLRADPEWEANYRRKLRSKRLKRNFGITLDQYDAMFASQGGVCALCGKPEQTQKGKLSKHCNSDRHLSVDHCHSTGKVRSLLCRNCNTGLGAFQDDVELLRKAIEYITACQG